MMSLYVTRGNFGPHLSYRLSPSRHGVTPRKDKNCHEFVRVDVFTNDKNQDSRDIGKI